MTESPIHIPDNAMVGLELDPEGHALVGLPSARGEGVCWAVERRKNGQKILEFSLDPAHPMDGIEIRGMRADMPLSDGVFLVSHLYFVGHRSDADLHADGQLIFIFPEQETSYALPHPPRIETCKHILTTLPLPTRIQLLVEACTVAVPIWTHWAAQSDLSYFDGIMAMDTVDQFLAESTIAAADDWLKSGETSVLQRLSGKYRSLHWPSIEGELHFPDNVYYSLYAPCNLARCILDQGNMELAMLCIKQATAARATNGADQFLGEPFRAAFFTAWWRAALSILCGEP